MRKETQAEDVTEQGLREKKYQKEGKRCTTEKIYIFYTS
jgi:hypothetical protein